MPIRTCTNHLAEFQQALCGDWCNLPFGEIDGKSVGGEDNPLSYNIMPLPEAADLECLGRVEFVGNVKHRKNLTAISAILLFWEQI